jgi:tetratricopeptide (TPR) repeat protein
VSLEVGHYTLQVGGVGTLIQSNAAPAGSTESLARALNEPERKADGEGGGAAAEIDAASEMTARIERAVSLGKGVSEGQVLNPDQLALEVGALLDLLERLDRTKEYKKALRLARAMATLLMLLKRWAELLRTLRAALRAGEELGDQAAVAWAKHEIGTLRIAAGDVEGAERELHEAQAIRERIGDRRGLAATRRNMQVLCDRLQQMLRDKELVRPEWRRPTALRLLLFVGLLAFLFGGVVGASVFAGESDEVSQGVDRGTEPERPTTSSGNGDITDGIDYFTLAIALAGEGGGTVVVNGESECEPSCETDFPAGEEVLLVASALKDSEFVGFSGACESIEEACRVTMTSAMSVTATFDPADRSDGVLEDERTEDQAGAAAKEPDESDTGEEGFNAEPGGGEAPPKTE